MFKVAVVIVNYNGQEYWPALAQSLQTTHYPANDWQVIVVDNASTDNSLTWLKENYQEAVLLPQAKNLGFAEGNNIGMRYALQQGFDYIFLLNQDTEVTPDWLQPLVNLMVSDEQIGAVQPKLYLWPDKDKFNTVGNRIHFLGFGYSEASGIEDQNQYKSIREINYPSGAGVLLRCSALEKVGLFNEDMFMYLEDLDLGWRLWLAGYKCLFQPTSMIYHKYEFNRSMKQVFWFERNRLFNLLTNYRLGTLLLIFPGWLLMEIGQFFYALRSGWLKEKIKAYFVFAQPETWIKIGEQRRRVKKLRQVSDRYLLKKFTGEILFQELNNPALIYVANPIFKFYLKVLRFIVIW